ncbi:MAG TPA: histidine phosphatase family protein [Acidimicrobiales bacterium]|nr:histidine phosphatase family protein [Acidimicrobiales bacterium]
MDETTVLLARHGRTGLNADGRLRGRLDPELDEVGWGQARALAQAAARYEPRLVVTSPLRRAVQTGQIVAELGGLPTRTEPGFIDRDYGELAGAPAAEVVARWGSVDAAPGVERAAEVDRRAIRALDAVAADAGGSTVVVVAHDAVNRLLLAALDPDAYPDPEAIPQPTGCFNILTRAVPAGPWRVREVGVVPR